MRFSVAATMKIQTGLGYWWWIELPLHWWYKFLFFYYNPGNPHKAKHLRKEKWKKKKFRVINYWYCYCWCIRRQHCSCSWLTVLWTVIEGVVECGLAEHFCKSLETATLLSYSIIHNYVTYICTVIMVGKYTSKHTFYRSNYRPISKVSRPASRHGGMGGGEGIALIHSVLYQN